MARKKDDKRVLRAGNGRQQTSKRNRRIRNNNRHSLPRQNVNRRTVKKRKSNKSLLIIMIVALIAFVIGAGIGVSLSLNDDSSDEGPQYENVTKEMTKDLNVTEDVSYDKEADDIDFNENETSQLNIETKSNSGN